jgi:hypothetical protein
MNFDLHMLNEACLSFCSDDALAREDCVVAIYVGYRFYQMLFCYPFGLCVMHLMLCMDILCMEMLCINI